MSGQRDVYAYGRTVPYVVMAASTAAAVLVLLDFRFFSTLPFASGVIVAVLILTASYLWAIDRLRTMLILSDKGISYRSLLNAFSAHWDELEIMKINNYNRLKAHSRPVIYISVRGGRSLLILGDLKNTADSCSDAIVEIVDYARHHGAITSPVGRYRIERRLRGGRWIVWTILLACMGFVIMMTGPDIVKSFRTHGWFIGMALMVWMLIEIMIPAIVLTPGAGKETSDLYLTRTGMFHGDPFLGMIKWGRLSRGRIRGDKIELETLFQRITITHGSGEGLEGLMREIREHVRA